MGVNPTKVCPWVKIGVHRDLQHLDMAVLNNMLNLHIIHPTCKPLWVKVQWVKDFLDLKEVHSGPLVILSKLYKICSGQDILILNLIPDPEIISFHHPEEPLSKCGLL